MHRGPAETVMNKARSGRGAGVDCGRIRRIFEPRSGAGVKNFAKTGPESEVTFYFRKL